MSSSNEFTVFKRFKTKSEAEAFQLLLNEKGIASELVDNSYAVDLSFSGDTSNDETQVFIHQSDFEAAKEVVKQEALNTISNLPEDYYLFSFSNEELIDVVKKAHEWNELDVLLAQKLLEERGEHISEAQLAEWSKAHKESEEKQLSVSVGWIIICYLSCLCGGIVGAFVGWHLWKTKKVLSNGEKRYTYDKSARHHGGTIFAIGVVIFLATIARKVLKTM